MNLVWFKKDLRVHDHLALFEAVRTGQCIGIFVFEDQWFESAEFSIHHLQFCIDSLLELEQELEKLNIPFLVLRGDCVRIFDELHSLIGFDHIFSHEETGLMWIYKRDQAVKSWCKSKKIRWTESPQFSVIRGLQDRNQWNSLRKKIIEREKIPKIQRQADLNLKGVPNSYLYQGLIKERNYNLQTGGRKQALELLESFLAHRGENYQSEMSSPVTAYDSCSRLSAHIAWGTISLTEITHELRKAQTELYDFDPKQTRNWRRSLKSFESRLWWHCHFIQKLESEPEIEFQNINRAFDGLRENDFCEEKFQAWANGQTGYPLIDACMRALHKTGWINFRMRAMLVSFASYQLWLHWKRPAQHLAQLFTDFEPGIHYSQIQMQSGVTGINAIRIYSPYKQSIDQDPKGEFLRQYLPELEALDDSSIHQPDQAPPMLLLSAGLKLGKSYPLPIVDAKESYNKAKKKIYTWRGQAQVRAEAKKVYQKHGSRKNQFFPKQNRSS